MSQQGLASIGVDVQVNKSSLNYVQEIGDMGGTPSELDATCLKDRIKKSVPGVQDAGTFELTYLFDNSGTDSDYRKLKALESAGTVTDIEVALPDGTKFKNTCFVSTYVEGAKVDALLTAKFVASLQGEWTVTNPST